MKCKCVCFSFRMLQKYKFELLCTNINYNFHSFCSHHILTDLQAAKRPNTQIKPSPLVMNPYLTQTACVSGSALL